MEEAAKYIILGWALGFLSTLGVRYLDNQKKKKDFKESLLLEIKELLPRLAGTYHILMQDIGELSKNSASWTYSIHSKYPGELDDETVEFIKKVAEAPEEEVAKLSVLAKGERNIAKHVKEFGVSLLENDLSSINLLRKSLREPMLIIHRNIKWINAHIGRCNFYFEKSFDGSVSEENREIMDVNRRGEHKRIATYCRETADICLKVIEGV